MPANSTLILRPGDKLFVEVADSADTRDPDINTGTYTVARDGAIYGATFGRVEVSGKTIAEAQKLIRTALVPFAPPNEVFVSLKSEASEFVFLYFTSGEEAKQQSMVRGPIPFTNGLTLREVISSATITEPNLWTVTVERGGKKIISLPLSAPLKSGIKLQMNDLILVSPVHSIKVWISGFLPKAGRYRVSDGTSLGQLIDLAGGVNTENINPPIDASDLRATILRSGQSKTYPITPNSAKQAIQLKDGDQISIFALPVVRFSVLGHVNHPGEFEQRGSVDIYRAISDSGGISPNGSLKNIVVYRGNQEVFAIDASGPQTGKDRPVFSIQTGDLVYAQTNKRVYYVLGSVKSPGRFVMKDSRVYHLTDALSIAGGITDQGVLRRIFISHPEPNGIAKIKEYRLDEFLRDGKESQNPVIHPGDAILFTNNRGISLQSVTTALSIGVLLDTLIRHP